jgi:signal transduction histidine kinase
MSRIDFLQETSRQILTFCQCEGLEFRVVDLHLHYRWEVDLPNEGNLVFVKSDFPVDNAAQHQKGNPDFDLLPAVHDFLKKSSWAKPLYTETAIFWILNLDQPAAMITVDAAIPVEIVQNYQQGYRALIFIPFRIEENREGLLILKSQQPNFFQAADIEIYESLAQIIGISIAHRRSQTDLNERIKELTCLYGIAQLVQAPGIALPDIIWKIAKLIPPAFQYPEATVCCLVVDGITYALPNFIETPQQLRADIIVRGEKRGHIVVTSLKEQIKHDIDWFLWEEQKLIETIAKQLALIIEGVKIEEDRKKLEEQLRHADRLATIGQLAAGVAHELNEPLGNILGFAQLMNKTAGLPNQTQLDLARIINASLHAREVVRKLLIFSRQMPTRKIQLNLNDIIDKGLYFIESRCAKEGITLSRNLAPDLPMIYADPSQMNQIVVNLVVNAIQSMPRGGKIRIATHANNAQSVSLVVEDSGEGMNDDVMKKIFLPFFTTKEVGQGTGLGLAVVHGIVTSHSGRIQVRSEVGLGSCFEIILPVTLPGNSEGIVG